MTCLQSCADCPFGGARVGGRGPIDSRLVVVGESPGREEVRQGQPFVGPTGDVLTQSLRRANINPDTVYYTNALQCYPGKTDDKDTSKIETATRLCQQRLYNELSQHPRDVILALGNPAMWSVTNNFGLKITQQRGKVFDTPLAKHTVLSVHPSFLMRRGPGATYRQYQNDVIYSAHLLGGGSRLTPPRVQYRVAQSVEEIQLWASWFRQWVQWWPGLPIAADVETSHLEYLRGRMLCAGFAPFPEVVYVIPEHLLSHMGILFVEGARYIWHFGKFDWKFCHHEGIREARVDEDTGLMSYTLDEYGGIHDLEQVSSDILNSPDWKTEMKRKHNLKKSDSFEKVPREDLHAYMALDIGNTRAIFDPMEKEIKADRHLTKLYRRTHIPASAFLARVEQNGIYVDTKRVAENVIHYEGGTLEDGTRVRGVIEGFVEQLNEIVIPIAGGPINVNSHEQVNTLLYDILKMPMWKGKRTSDKKFLEHLPKHPVLELITRIRRERKSLGTYVSSIEKKKRIHVDGKIHTTLKIHASTTGRLASEEPNLQNQPRDPRLRGQYIATPGRRLLEVDLNQAELRVLACLSGDPELCRIYLEATIGLHDEVRLEIWGDPKDWSQNDLLTYQRKFNVWEASEKETIQDILANEQKMRAKNINFGIVYGITSAGLAEQSGVTPQEAQVWLNAWAKKFSVAWDFLQQCRRAPVLGKSIVSPFGQKRRFGVVGKEKLHDIQNQAANFLEQHCASHITLHSGMEIEKRLRDECDAWTVNLIHDALLNETPDDDAIVVQAARMVKAKMEEVPIKWGFTRIPFIADAKQGYRWGSLEKMKL